MSVFGIFAAAQNGCNNQQQPPPKPMRPGGLASASSTGNLLTNSGLSLPRAPSLNLSASLGGSNQYSSGIQQPTAGAFNGQASWGGIVNTQSSVGTLNGQSSWAGVVNNDLPVLGYIVAHTPEQIAELMKGPSPTSTPRRQPVKPPMPAIAQVSQIINLR